MTRESPGNPSTDAEPSDHVVERQSPETAFSLLGNETRIAILYALAESLEGERSFSDLRERVGARDSGQFNYHLGKLSGHFVRKTEDGYELTMAGARIVGALRAGTYTADVSIDPIELEDPCPRCDGTLVVAYEDEHVRLSCRDCDEIGNQYPFPPGTVEQFDREELPEAFDRWLRTTVERTVAGFCPLCFGRLDPRLLAEEDQLDGVTALFECERCGEVAQLHPRALLYAHPGGSAFFFDHGIDVDSTPTWQLEARGESEMELIEVDPPRLRLEVVLDGERLVATIDSTVEIGSIERESA